MKNLRSKAKTRPESNPGHVFGRQGGRWVPQEPITLGTRGFNILKKDMTDTGSRARKTSGTQGRCCVLAPRVGAGL